MSTPFQAFKNCVITFQVPIDSGTRGETGNLKFKTKPLVVEAWLKEARNPNIENTGAGTIDERYVTGKCINPNRLPQSILPETIADVVFDDGSKYKYRFIGKVPSPFYDEKTILGQRLNGFISVASEWGNS